MSKKRNQPPTHKLKKPQPRIMDVQELLHSAPLYFLQPVWLGEVVATQAMKILFVCSYQNWRNTRKILYHMERT